MNGKLCFILLGASLAISACSSSRTASQLNSTGQPQTVNVQTNNPLALPPDISLPQPGSAPAARSVAAAPLDTDTDYSAPATPIAPARKGDVFTEYGISKTNPDGTPKTDDQLQKELKAAILKRKQQQNPSYGTIFNMGNVFRDG